jgi:hypothetical protein
LFTSRDRGSCRLRFPKSPSSRLTIIQLPFHSQSTNYFTMQTTTRQIARTSGITPSQCLRSAAKRHLQAKRPSAQPQYRPLGASFATSSKRHDSTRFVPTILQPSFWRTIIPKSLRTRTPPPEDGPVAKSKEWNPATFFIVIFLLIGSQAIQTIALQRSYTSFSNQTEARLSLLRDVLRRVQAGEDVDVETALGTGNEVKEKEWEEGTFILMDG